MVAMLFTAFSYGRMARAYPSAGSAFTYVGQEINPALGYVTGWSMVMDYMLNPMICIIWCSQQAHVFAPGVHYLAWAVFFGAIFTFLNIQGIKTSARVNTALAAGMGAVVAVSSWPPRGTFSAMRTATLDFSHGHSTTDHVAESDVRRPLRSLCSAISDSMESRLSPRKLRTLAGTSCWRLC